ncbi:hypothetical protein LR48_Vigan07g192100 [Vigna angularis]|uniref:Uncharacterized protein n=1 Tax=Phaseolus angularis TaxID=3914 RepID=A0A0L9V036_PHAAN|nr:hypothetical protein LR48_Vigan07g192100 [Vigna angularis]
MAEPSRRRRRRTSGVSESNVHRRDATIEGWLFDEQDQQSFSQFWKERKIIKQKFIDLAWYTSYNFSFPNLIIEQGVQHIMELRGSVNSSLTLDRNEKVEHYIKVKGSLTYFLRVLGREWCQSLIWLGLDLISVCVSSVNLLLDRPNSGIRVDGGTKGYSWLWLIENAFAEGGMYQHGRDSHP